MKPRKLVIKGLNSFIEEQVIDFESLTSKGIFGIFGPTGSGKSTILDAITLALYGDIARDSKEYINSLCNGVNISYEFEIGVGTERKVYIADRIVNKDKHGSYKLKTCRLIEREGESLNPIAEGAKEVKAKVEEIIGLKAEDFTRSVVLPQGKFNEFLKLTGSQRRDMLERIFNLEKYGRALGDKIKKVRREKQEKLNIVNSKIESFGERGVSEEAYEALKLQIKALKDEEEKLKEEKKTIDLEYERVKGLWQLQKELKGHEKQREELLYKKDNIESMKLESDRAKRASIVKPLLDNMKNTEEGLQANKKEHEILALKLKNIEEELKSLENKYKEALDKKDKELPRLIEKEGHLQRALKLETDIEALNKEREELARQYKSLTLESNTLKKNLEELDKNKIALEEEKMKVEALIEDNKVSPEMRNHIIEASMVEREATNSFNKLKDLEVKLKEKENAIKTLKGRLEVLEKQYDTNKNTLDNASSKLEELKENFPGDNTLLIEKERNNTFLTLALKDFTEATEQKRFIEDKIKVSKKSLSSLDEKKQQALNKINSQKETLELIVKEIEKINKDNLAGILAKDLKEGEPCPVCGSINHTSIAAEKSTSDLEHKNTIKEGIEKEIAKLEFDIREIEFEASKDSMMLEVLEKDLLDKSEKIRNINVHGIDIATITLEEFKVIQEKSLKDLEKLRASIESWNKQKELLDNDINSLKEVISNIEKERERYISSLALEDKAFTELNKEAKEAQEKYLRLKESLDKSKKELNIEDIKKALDGISIKDKNCLELENKLKNILDSMKNFEKGREDIKNNISELGISLAKIEEVGKEKRTLIDKYKEERDILADNKPVAKYLKEIVERKNIIIKEELNLRENLELLKKTKQEVYDKVLSIKQNIENLSNLYKKQYGDFAGALQENNLKDEEEVLKYILDKGKIELLDKEIKEYENDLNNIEVNIKSISEKLKGESVEETVWNEITNKKEQIAESLETKIKEIASREQSLKTMEEDLKTLGDVLKEVKELAHLCSNLDDLSKLVEGNKFVEFVAQNQLKYISMEASKRLKSITRGRYALEIDDSGNFIMRDDFSGGTRRSTNTLSGGETFLTSLSLALALSSQIQLKGSAPLEFFFLDEGFGTLDSDLLDTVITSLENLHSNKLCIGLISHVEELKNRVPIKLILEKSSKDGIGSSIYMELT